MWKGRNAKINLVVGTGRQAPLIVEDYGGQPFWKLTCGWFRCQPHIFERKYNLRCSISTSVHHQHQCICTSAWSAHQHFRRISMINALAGSAHQQDLHLTMPHLLRCITTCLCLCLCVSLSSRGHQWIICVMSFRNMGLWSIQSCSVDPDFWRPRTLLFS